METGNQVNKHISENPWVMSALGPNLFGNALNAFFFINGNIGESENYSTRKLVSYYRKIWKNFKRKIKENLSNKEYAIATLFTFTGGNAITWYAYSHLAKENQVPFTIGSAYFVVSLFSILSLIQRKKFAERTRLA